LSANDPPPANTALYEKRAKSWDRWTTIIIVALLMVPLPFARFKAWPDGKVLNERLVMPWSWFQLCYTTFPGGEIVEETYHFTWKGEVIPRSASSFTLFTIDANEPPLLKWQNSPPMRLEQLFLRGDMLRLETVWQPVLLWPLRMLWQLYTPQ
jgi:hypothetical protein